MMALAGVVSSAGSFHGQVVGVVDGDTIDVMREGVAVRIRLDGIDCPEKKQAYGTRAKQFTSRLAFGKEVQVLEKGLDRIIDEDPPSIQLPDHKNIRGKRNYK